MKDWRIYFVFFLILAVGAAIAGRMYYLQVVKNSYYAALSHGQNFGYDKGNVQRGSIFFKNKFSDLSGETQISDSQDKKIDDADNLIAATNKEWFAAYAIPREIEDVDSTAEKLAFLFDELEEKKVIDKLKKVGDPYEPIINELDKETADSLDKLKLPGIYVKPERLRYYPSGSLASHALGFVGYKGSERIGQYGAEGFYDAGYLNQGASLKLSIDYNIQFVLEEKLKKAKNTLDAEGASGVVMNPSTGEIAALAVLDEFDLNNYSDVENIDIFLNDITQKRFEPGSVFKPFTIAAALDANRASPQTTYKDEGRVEIGEHVIKNSDNKSYGEQTMTNVLELSLNTGAVFAEKLLGHDSFRAYIRLFGFDKKTGADLQGEVGGDIQNILYTSRDINFATASFGQGIAITPIQLITAFSAFANGGEVMRPHVVEKIIDKDSVEKIVEPELIANPISAKTAAQITAMLVSVVENGWGEKAGVPGYKVAGKTGTAQVPKEGGRGYSDKTIHSFIGYAPAYNPRFIALVKLDNPKGINFSADSVAPLFSEVAEYILNYYQVPPDSN